jgi:hypothetical protein
MTLLLNFLLGFALMLVIGGFLLTFLFWLVVYAMYALFEAIWEILRA